MEIASPEKRWLLVDDDPAVLEITARVLRSLPGSDVVACDDPRRALDIFCAEPEQFELLVTDFDMPWMDGLELASRARARSPQLHVLLMSGSGLKAASVLSAGLDAFLPKPFGVLELIQTVQKLVVSPGEALHR